MDPNREHPGWAKPPGAAAHLRALLELARLVRTGCELPELLDAVAKIGADPLGFGTVVINLCRPKRDECEVKAVLGSERARELLLGNVSAAESWVPMLDPRFLRRGAFFVPAEGLEW